MRLFLLASLPVALALAIWWSLSPRALDRATLAAHYETPLPRPAHPMQVYHLGHSLVGQDMPAMLAQLMGEGYGYALQLGWGASLDQHWRGEVPGFDSENDTEAHRPAHEAVASGIYDAVVLTEMVELRDAIRYHDSPRALADWAQLARAARPDVRLYLYETWHGLDDPAGWEARIARDLPDLWEGEVLAGAKARPGVGTIHVIPAGQAMAAVVRAMEAGQVPGLDRREMLFRKNPDGTQDVIHLSDLGAYVVALTHFAVLAGETPVGLPHALRRADGSLATAPSAEAAAVLQQVVWQVVTGYAATGVAAPGVSD